MGKRLIAFVLLLGMAGLASATLLKWTNSMIIGILPFPAVLLIMALLLSE